MFINKTTAGLNNRCGAKIAEKRKALGFSQRKLADELQLIGMDIDKNGIQRIEAGKRFVTDIEIVFFSKVLELTYSELLD